MTMLQEPLPLTISVPLYDKDGQLIGIAGMILPVFTLPPAARAAWLERNEGK